MPNKTFQNFDLESWKLVLNFDLSLIWEIQEFGTKVLSQIRGVEYGELNTGSQIQGVKYGESNFWTKIGVLRHRVAHCRAILEKTAGQRLQVAVLARQPKLTQSSAF